MILLLTNRCKMECTHCMEDATPDGEHMTMETFNKCIPFIKRLNPLVILVGGGEPLENPLFFDMVKELLKYFDKKQVCIISNGMFLNNPEMVKKVIELDVPVQITNDVRYYPKRINIIKHKNFIYETHIRSIYPQGRAVTNKIPKSNTKAPKCFNVRSFALSNKYKFADIFMSLAMMQKFCQPLVDVDGNIHIGESRLCNSIGNVATPFEELLENIKNFKCNKCGMEDTLPEAYRNAIHK